MLHSLTGVDSMIPLQNLLLVGASWEGFVIEPIIATYRTAYEYYFYRTRQGAECDLLLVKTG
ncbi:MAG: DUF4143 domain-containing protein [Algoriphagus sp.]|nr:DUF4143 domain-containing protein [Algoriphagus sp.]